jgi:lysophospholipase L1-like esterase
MGILAYWFASGMAGIFGMALIVLGTLLTFRKNRKKPEDKEGKTKLRVLPRLAILCGLILLLLGSVPISIVLFRILGILIVALAFCSGFESPTTRPFLALLRILIIAIGLYSLAHEWKMWRMPAFRYGPSDTVYVIGDSLSAGIGFSGERTWIDIVRDERPDLTLVTYTAGGATLDYAIEKASSLYEDNAWVILEIGGNDILNGLSSDQYKVKLDQLFRTLRRQKNRTIVMFELPLPPFASLYGYHLREVAGRYGVHLVPRWVLSNLITGENTCDGLHFSNEGHRSMANTALDLIGRNDPERK